MSAVGSLRTHTLGELKLLEHPIVFLWEVRPSFCKILHFHCLIRAQDMITAANTYLISKGFRYLHVRENRDPN